MRTDFGGGSVRSVILGLALRSSVRPLIDAWTLAPDLPWPYDLVDHAGRLQRKVPGTRARRVRLPHCEAYVVRTPKSRDDRHVLYFHGGAFVVGGRHLHTAMLSRIAEKTGATITAVRYRKLPRHTIGDAVADGVAGYRHLLAKGVRPDQIVFMGDSAGGWMTFTVTDEARAEGLPAPSALVAMSPLVDLDLVRSPMERARGCTLFGPRAIPTFSRVVLRRGAVKSPHDCELGALPPVLIQVSSSESLYGQVCRLHDRLEQAGVPVELQVWDGQVHVFQAAALLDEAQQAIHELAAYVDRALAAPQVATSLSA